MLLHTNTYRMLGILFCFLCGLHTSLLLLQISIYPPPVMDDYCYRLKISCESKRGGRGNDGEKKIMMIVMEELHGKKRNWEEEEEDKILLTEEKSLSEKNVKEIGQSMKCVKENFGTDNSAQSMKLIKEKSVKQKAMKGETVKEKSVENLKEKEGEEWYNKMIKIDQGRRDRLKECADGEVIIQIVRVRTEGHVCSRKEEEKLMVEKVMKTDEFLKVRNLEFDFEQNYQKHFRIVSHLANQKYQFTLRCQKAAGTNSQGFLTQSECVLYSRELIGHTVDITVPISRAQKCSEKRGQMEVKVEYAIPEELTNNKAIIGNDHQEKPRTDRFVKIYFIKDSIWHNHDKFLIDFKKDKIIVEDD